MRRPAMPISIGLELNVLLSNKVSEYLSVFQIKENNDA